MEPARSYRTQVDESIDAGIVDHVAALELPHDAGAARIAREFVAENAAHLNDDVVYHATLLVSELVSNAVRHGRPQVSVRVRFHPPGLDVAVSDQGADLPEFPARHPPMTQRSGRGLLIVDAFAADWGIQLNEPPPGKTVWFQLAS